MELFFTPSRTGAGRGEGRLNYSPSPCSNYKPTEYNTYDFFTCR